MKDLKSKVSELLEAEVTLDQFSAACPAVEQLIKGRSAMGEQIYMFEVVWLIAANIVKNRLMQMKEPPGKTTPKAASQCVRQ